MRTGQRLLLALAALALVASAAPGEADARSPEEKAKADKKVDTAPMLADAAGEPAEESAAPAEEPPDEAPAEETSEPYHVTYEKGGLAGTGLVIGIKVGAGIAQAFSELGTNVIPEFELSYCFPFANQALSLFVSGQWFAPSLEGSTSEPDPRLPGDGIMKYEVTQHQAIISVGLLARIPLENDLFRPYLGAGARFFLTETEVSGSSNGEPFGTNRETTTVYGFIAMVGGEFYVGPVGLFLELQTGYGDIDAYVMRDTNLGSLNVMLGARLFL